MRDRVFGIETEYAVIYHPSRSERRPDGHVGPTNLEIFQYFAPALAECVRGVPRAFSLLRAKPGTFLENGGSFHYEATPQDFEHGLIEMASPECRDPFVLLACERAKDGLVEDASLRVNTRLRRAGRSGELRIGKNNVDSRGHTFGSHENYWVEDPLSWPRRLALLPIWIGLWALTLPVLAWLVAMLLLLALAGIALAATPLIGSGLRRLGGIVARRSPTSGRRLATLGILVAGLPRRLADRMAREPGFVVRRLAWLEWPLQPLVSLHAAVYNRFHFRAIRRALTAFLVTRAVYAGAGSVVLDGGPLLRLAQRPPHLRALSRIFTSGSNRPLYECRDPFFRPFSAFGRKRRLHLLLGDANLCDWAMVLRVGATALVLEAIESEPSADWPEIETPLAALRRWNDDPSLTTRLRLCDGTDASALGVQRRYLELVERILTRHSDWSGQPAWKARVLEMWRETLELLERDPEQLVDRIDWIAKRRLLRAALARGGPESWSRLEREGTLALQQQDGSDGGELRALAFRALRTDLRYHELGERGDHRRLQLRGDVRELAEPEAVRAARREPPVGTRAHGRGHAIRHAASGPGGAASWRRVRTGWRRVDWFDDPLSGCATGHLGPRPPCSGRAPARGHESAEH